MTKRPRTRQHPVQATAASLAAEAARLEDRAAELRQALARLDERIRTVSAQLLRQRSGPPPSR